MIVYDTINEKMVGIDTEKFVNTNHFDFIPGRNRRKSEFSISHKIQIDESKDDSLTIHIKKELLQNKSPEQIFTDLNEGLFGSILGGLTGFALGKKIGEVICNVLGIGNGLLKDLLTSRLFGAALGSSIGKRL